MPLQQFRKDVQGFTRRIREALLLQADDYMLIHQKRKVITWIQEQTASLKERRQQEKRNQGLLTGILNLTGMNEASKKLQNEEMVLQKVKEIMKGNAVNIEQIDLEQLSVPSKVKQCLKRLKKQSAPNYYAVVKGPLIKGSYIQSREGLDNCIKAVSFNGLKFTVLGSEPSNIVKHQRSLLEQLFNKLFWKESQLSMVIKIQVQKESFQKCFDIYCYIEDISAKQWNVLRQLGQIMRDKDENLYIMNEEKKMFVDQMSIFNCFLSQMLTVPIQTIVSGYAVVIQDEKAKLIRTHNKNQNSDISFLIKDHPSLRSPLFYFANYIKIHQFSIQSIKSLLELRHFYEDFYQILNMLIDFIQKDFTIKTSNSIINSLLITHQFFNAIWKIFHEFIILSNWIEQIINPIKQTITLYQINAKIMPIFNQILKLQKGTFNEYQKLLLNFPIQNYLTMNVSKATIEHYKDRFININTTEIYPINCDIFESIFQKTIKDYNISNINTHEVIYFFNFIAKHHSLIYKDNYAGCHPSWRNRKIWKEMSHAINKDFSQIKYLSVCLEILAFYFDFDFKKYSQHPFHSIINDEQAPKLFERIEIFTKILKQKYDKKYNEYLSLLLERSFKYGRYKVVQFLIKKGIQLINYQEIFTDNPEISQDYDKMIQKQDTIQFMKNSEPEMFRNYQWQKFVNVKMKQNTSSSTIFQTVRRGKFSIASTIQFNIQSRNMMSNTLSRKDYMYSNTRHIGKITVKKQEAYIQMTQYPLLRYFYESFLKRVNKSSLMPNFCGFFTDTGKLIHLIQSLPNCSNYRKTLTASCEADLAKHIDHQEISEAIIISMMLMPANISLNNIFISYGHVNQHGLNGNYNHFVIDFHDFYQKNGFQFSAGSANLKVKNSLFLFEQMKSDVSAKLMKKYSNLAIFEVINNVFKESSVLVSQINKIKQKSTSIPQQERQLFSIIFQDNFCESLVQRMFKIQRAFDKSLKTKVKISHLQLLELINPQLSYFYNQIIETSSKLLDRQRCLMDDNFKKSLVVNQNLINFFPNPVNTQQSRDNFPNHYKKFTFQGPSQNLANFYQNILKFDIYTKKITELGDYNHNVIEYFIKNVDLSLYQKQQRENLINKIQDYSKLYLRKQKNCLPLSIIRFNNIEQLKQKNIYFSGQRLKQLILQQTSSNESEVNTLLRRYESMRSLIIRNVSALQRIGDSVSDTYDFKNLKYLSIVGCRDLLNVNLKCEQLEQVTLRRNPSLTEIYVFSKKLKDMDCYECPKLRLENIGIYILKKVNVLLSPNCCDGQILKLQDKNYSIFLTKILRYLLNCFQASKAYKLQLIMTLLRLELIDEKLLGFKHNQIYNKNMTNTLAKMGPEILDIAISQIFDIFLRNDLIEVLNFDELLKINIRHLVIIEDYFSKLLKMKENSWYNYRRSFNSLIFKQFSKSNEGQSQSLKFVKTLLSLIDIDKTVEFHLSISNDNFINGYSELINLLNKRLDLQRLQLKISNSTISDHFMKYLFTLDGPRNRICKIQFSNCNLKVDHKISIALSFIKSLTFTECRISCLDFIQNFTYLTNLQFNSCKFDHEVFEVYEKIGKLKSLLNLSIINIKRSLKDGKLHLSRLFENLMKLTKLQYLDFSDNQLNKDEISYFSGQIHNVTIYQLNLYNFHEDGLNEYINFFLYHESIKIIGVQFKLRSIKFFEAFIDTLSHNTSIVKVNLKTDQEFQTKHFQKIKNNCKLEAILSNHPIPNCIKNHINSNSYNKSIPAILTEQSFEPDRSSREKNEDYCRIGLSLDGGGARGLLLATNMDYISRKVGKPLHKIFDYIGGTSIGGVLALASTGTSDGNTPICSSQQLMDIFEIYGDSIFRKTQFSNIVSLFQTKYDIKSYSDMLYGYFKQTKLSDVLKGTNVVVNAVNRHTNEDVIFRSINAIFDRNQDFYMKDVSRATSAAPIYFPSAQIKNINATVSYSLIDGGVGMNNPSKLVIDDIIKITQNQAHKKNYFLLSLGTGKLRNEAVPANAGIKDIVPIIDSLTISANYFLEKDLSENYRGHYLRVSPYIDMDRKDSQLDNTTPQTYRAYKKFALDAAEENYSSTIAFGKFKNQSFIEWLRENTDRKHETR